MGTFSSDSSPLCPHCLLEVSATDHLCPRCGGPITPFASIDPILQMQATGFAYRKALQAPGRTILIGIWLIFAPQIPLLVWLLISAISRIILPQRVFYFPGGTMVVNDENGRFHLVVTSVVALGLLSLYVGMLWKVTRRFYTYRRESRKRKPEAKPMSIQVPPWQARPNSR